MNSFSDKNSDLDGYQPRNPPKILSDQVETEGREAEKENEDADVQASIDNVPFVLDALKAQNDSPPPSFLDRMKSFLPFGGNSTTPSKDTGLHTTHPEASKEAPDYSAITPPGPSGSGNNRVSLKSKANTAGNLPNASASERAAHAVQFFVNKGWSSEQAIGITANLVRESNLNPNASGDSGLAKGIAQWHPDREKAFNTKFGKSMTGSSLDDQLAFVDLELREGSEKQAGLALARTRTPEEAAATVSRKYERPLNVASEMQTRGQMATKLAASLTLPTA